MEILIPITVKQLEEIRQMFINDCMNHGLQEEAENLYYVPYKKITALLNTMIEENNCQLGLETVALLKSYNIPDKLGIKLVLDEEIYKIKTSHLIQRFLPRVLLSSLNQGLGLELKKFLAK